MLYGSKEGVYHYHASCLGEGAQLWFALSENQWKHVF